MKILFVFMTLLLFMQPAFAELTPEDVKIITDIVKGENDALEKRLREYVDLKFEILDTKFTTKFEDVSKQQTLILILVTGLLALIVVAIGIPQIIIALKQRTQGDLEAEIKSLREKVELLEQTRLVRPQ